MLQVSNQTAFQLSENWCLLNSCLALMIGKQENLNLFKGRIPTSVPNKHVHWALCICIFGPHRMNQHHNLVWKLHPKCLLFSTKGKMQKSHSSRTEYWTDFSGIMVKFHTELTALSCLLYDQWHMFLKCVTWAGVTDVLRQKNKCSSIKPSDLSRKMPITHKLQISLNWIHVCGNALVRNTLFKC